MWQTFTTVSLAITAVLSTGCDAPFSFSTEARAENAPTVTQIADNTYASTDESTKPPDMMSDSQAREMMREDWLEEQSPTEAANIAQEEGSEGESTLRGVVNLNNASTDSLMMLPGIGPATAARIVEYRQKRPFKKADHLKRIKGIGPKTWAKLEAYVSVTGETTLSE
jgi:competence ComEA-like helix-hairpin-helix protein